MNLPSFLSGLLLLAAASGLRGADANRLTYLDESDPFSSFVTTIENYPYPYVIGKLCWEFAGMVPSDWEAQHLHGNTNPVTLVDWQAALDATVPKQGSFKKTAPRFSSTQ